MDMVKILKIIYGIFIVSPLWIKIFIVLIVIGVPIAIFEKIIEIKDELHKKITKKMMLYNVSGLINSDVKKAFNKLIIAHNNHLITDEKYEEFLLLMIQKEPLLDAIEEISDFYRKKEEIEKYKYWIEFAAKSGSIKGIIEYYGFSDYDVISESYDEILSCLEKAKVTKNDRKENINFLIGIVQYKLGNTQKAKQIFNKIGINNLSIKNMFFKCSLKENNILEAEKILMELEEKKFTISKKDYLSIYNYYVSQRNNSNCDYAKELLYCEKYALCEDSNEDVANQIRGDSYYNLAIKLQKDAGDKDFISIKALKAYERAIEFGHAESMYLLGKYYWCGNGGRNYFYAIKYFLGAKQKGHQKAIAILNEYGFDGILIKSMKSQDVSYCFSDNYTLTVDSKVLDFLQLFHGMRYKSYLIVKAFEDAYISEFKSFQDIVNRVHEFYSDSIAYMMKWCTDLLVSLDIDIYGPDDILELCEDLSLLPRVPNFVRKIDEIDRRAEQLSLQANYAKATRTVWSGSGFGNSISSTIASSVKASIAAGIMNIGSDIMHGIGDGIVESMNDAELKEMGKKIFLSPETMKEFSNAINKACLEIVNAVMCMTKRQNHVTNSIVLKGSVVYKNEDLSHIDDKILLKKINNNLSVNKNDYAFALLIEAIRRNPLREDLFKQLFELAIQREENIEKAYGSYMRYAGDFGINLEYQSYFWIEK